MTHKANIQDYEDDLILPCHDAVDNPIHYQSESGLEAIEVIEAFELNFNLGNAIKYILRADKKGNKVQDLDKAIWYLIREIENS